MDENQRKVHFNDKFLTPFATPKNYEQKQSYIKRYKVHLLHGFILGLSSLTPISLIVTPLTLF